MPSMLHPRVLLPLVLLFSTLWAEDVTTKAPAPKLAFALKNQFDREYTEAYCAGQTALLVIADRKGSSYVQAWSKAIAHELDATPHPPTKWIGAATLAGVPAFMRGMVKKMFGGNENQWTLMDWHGHFAKAYALPAEHTCMLVFSPDGRLVFQASGREVNQEVAKSVVAAIVATAPPGTVAAAAK